MLELPLFCSFIITFLLTPLIKLLAERFEIFDNPNGRKIHNKPIPLLGGVGIFIGFIVCLIFFLYRDFKIYLIFVTSILVLLMGLLDDIKNLKVLWKVIVEALVAILLISSGIKLEVGSLITHNTLLAFIIDGLITLIWIVGIINATNFIDGLDSLCINIVFWPVIGFLFLGFMEGNEVIAYISLSLIGSILGFFPYNIYPARIFMGDAGSTFLGFILSILSILNFQQLKNPLAISIPILFLGIPIFDMLFVICKRIKIKKSIFVADNNHFHHRLKAIGLDHYSILFYMNSLSIIALLVGIIIYLTRTYTSGMIIVALLTIFILYRRSKSREEKCNDNQ